MIGTLIFHKQFLLISIAALIGLAACGPEKGTPEWCSAMKDKPQAAWTQGDAEIYVAKCKQIP